MKKLLLLLLIAPIIGNSQLLNLPVSNVIIIKDYGVIHTVPENKIWQLTGSTAKNNSSTSPFVNYGNEIPKIDRCLWIFVGDIPNYYNSNTIYGNSTYPSGTSFTLNDSYCRQAIYTFVEYDLNAQNLAYNVPNQTTPTLYPNPTSSLLALNSNKEYDIEVYDIAGNKVMALTGNSINMAHLSTATYIVKATDKSNNEELTYKVVKN